MAPRAPAVPSTQLGLWDDAAPPAANSAPLRAPPVFRHPRANREALLDGHLVGYEFRRGRRRTIGFSVAPEGLVVSAPRWVPHAEIGTALQEKARWIVRKLHEQDERSRRLAAQRVEWRDGATLPFLGAPVVMVLDPRISGSRLVPDEALLSGVPRHALHVGLPPTASAEQIRDAVQSWLQRQARRVFEERCAHFAALLNVRVTRLSLSSATTRWGSARADGAVRLHWKLVHFALPTIDYVVAHELAHLRVMDHSPRFWDVVRSVLPDYEAARDALRDEALPVLE